MTTPEFLHWFVLGVYRHPWEVIGMAFALAVCAAIARGGRWGPK